MHSVVCHPRAGLPVWHHRLSASPVLDISERIVILTEIGYTSGRAAFRRWPSEERGSPDVQPTAPPSREGATNPPLNPECRKP
jgi:hypothetical protein